MKPLTEFNEVQFGLTADVFTVQVIRENSKWTVWGPVLDTDCLCGAAYEIGAAADILKERQIKDESETPAEAPKAGKKSKAADNH